MQPKKLLARFCILAIVVFNPQYGLVFLLFLFLIKLFK
jgi:hypothetical protein